MKKNMTLAVIALAVIGVGYYLTKQKTPKEEPLAATGGIKGIRTTDQSPLNTSIWAGPTPAINATK